MNLAILIHCNYYKIEILNTTIMLQKSAKDFAAIIREVKKDCQLSKNT